MMEEQTINGLPKDWKIVDVSSIGRIETGSTPSKQNIDFYAADFPFYKPTDLEAGYNVREAKDNLSEAGIKQARFLPKNSILVTCIGATIGKTGLIRKAGASNQQINAIIPFDNIHPSFVYYQVIGPAFQKKIKDNASATTLPILNKTKFQNLPFVFAPIADQQQIVSKIEELFSELDKGIDELKTAQQQSKVYRQAVLKWAFEGKLTNEDVTDGELPNGWKWVKLGKACSKIQDGSHFSPKKQYAESEEGRFMYITAKNIRNDYMDLSKLTYVDKDFHDSIYQRCNPEYGDVLLIKDGVNTGEVTLNTIHEPFSLLSSVCIFKTDKTALTNSFLEYFIQSPFGSKAIANSMTGTAIKRIILRKIKRVSNCFATNRRRTTNCSGNRKSP